MLDFLKSKSAPQIQSIEQLFENQLAILTKRGCPASIVEAFDRSKKQILTHALLITVAEGHISFLPVITPCYLGYHGLMAMVRHNNQSGLVECEVDRISDTEEVPARLYYIFDVDDGMEWEGRPPEIAHTLICQNKRLPTTTAEILSVARHTDLLEYHPLNAVGSRYASDRTPMIWLSVMGTDTDWRAQSFKSKSDTPGLGWWYSSSPSRGGAPSCVSRLEI